MSCKWSGCHPNFHTRPDTIIRTRFDMPHFDLPYWDTTLSFTLPDSIHIDWISPADPPGVSNPLETVSEALNHPVGEVSLEQFAGAQSVAIAVNDKTRPVPHQYLLPP